MPNTYGYVRLSTKELGADVLVVDLPLLDTRAGRGCAFLTKPYQMEDLQKAVAEAVNSP